MSMKKNENFSMAQFLWCDCTFKKQCTVSVTLTIDPWRSMFFQWIECHPINILHKFQIDISSNSREIKYQNIGRTHTHRQTHTHTDRQTDRQTGWKQYLATPSGGEVITFIFIDFRVCDFAFAFKTQNAPCVSRFKRVLFSDRFQFAF